MKKIVFTGGGTAGHVTPNIALIPELIKSGYSIFYIGSYKGMEKELIEGIGIPYYGISSGKLRRYFALRNFTDPFRVLKGFCEAIRILKDIKPDIVFSKGGFVSVPVVLAAKYCKIPIIIHESDITPGLANKIAIKKAQVVCCNFPETLNYIPQNKGVLTGTPIRRELFNGDAKKALQLCGFQDHNKPVLLVMGGSSGANTINVLVRRNLEELLKSFYIIHLCGRGHFDQSLVEATGYKQFEYLREELSDVFALTDVVVSRAGANSICEIVSLAKPNLLIPLPLSASRGDQIQNAKSFAKQGFSVMLEEEQITDTIFLETLFNLYENRGSYIQKMKERGQFDSQSVIIDIIKKHIDQ